MDVNKLGSMSLVLLENLSDPPHVALTINFASLLGAQEVETLALVKGPEVYITKLILCRFTICWPVLPNLGCQNNSVDIKCDIVEA